MKKKKDGNKKNMPEFAFKEFTPEEDRIYHEAVAKLREAITQGKTLREAYESVTIQDDGLRSIVEADFLKIMIAELHYGKGLQLEELAKKLSVQIELIRDTIKRMLQEAGVTASQKAAQKMDD